MGNDQSNAGAAVFFGKVGGGLESLVNRGTNQFFDTLSMPQKMMQTANNDVQGATNFLSSPIGGILIPILAIDGLYIAVQVVKK